MTLVMGVVNVTPDSFSDGGRYDTVESAVAHGLSLLADGADILDIGGESTRPGATRPLVAEELAWFEEYSAGFADEATTDESKPLEAARAEGAAN